MKTFLRSSKKTVTGVPFIGKPMLAVFVALFCFNNGLQAGVTPVVKRGGNGGAVRKKAPAKQRLNQFSAPTINYGFPQNDVIGNAITTITPTSSGVGAFGYTNAPVAIGAGFNQPTATAIDKAGNIYVADYNNNLIKKMPAGGGSSLTISTGFIKPIGIAIDTTGNLYITDNGSSIVYEIAKGTSNVTTVGSGFDSPLGLATDVAGNVYVADHANSLVYKIPVGGGAPVTIGTGFYNPYAVAVDKAGNVYVADYNNSAIKKIAAVGGATTVVVSGLNGPTGVAVDDMGNIFIADNGNNAVEMLPVGGTLTTIGSGFTTPFGVSVDKLGRVYVADYGNSAIKELVPTGGYFISPALPAGLNFDNATGVISGTPTVLSPATNYGIIAYNSDGSTVATQTIAVFPLAFGYPGSPPAYTYNVGVPISSLSPTSVGVAAPAYSNALVAKTTGLGAIRAVATDVAGNIYVADFSDSKVWKIPAGGSSAVAIGTGFSGPDGVAVDALGNVYVSDYYNNAIKKIAINGGATTNIWTVSNPYGVAVDAAGNVYATDYNAHLVRKLPADGSAATTVGTGFTNPAGVAADVAGNIYVADFTSSLITKVPVGGGAQVTLGSGFLNPYGVTVDLFGNVFVADYGHTALKKIPVGGGAPVTLFNTFSTITGSAIGPDGIVYIADYDNSTLNQIKPVGGYYINALPAGLNFNNATGVFTGTPTAVSPATNYVVTAYNSLGSNNTSVNIKVNTLTINYPGSPVTLLAGMGMVPITPTSVSVAAPGYGTPVTFGSGISGPRNVATDAAGNVYVTDYVNSVVKKFPVGGGAAVTIGSGFLNPTGIAVDGGFNVYVADYGHNLVKKIPFGSNTPVIIGSGFNQPMGIAVEASGNVLVADKGTGYLKRIIISTNTTANLGSNYAAPLCVALDGVGNIYMGTVGTAQIKMLPVTGGTLVSLGSGFNNVYGLAVDAAGNVYVCDQTSNSVKEIPAGNGTIVTLSSAFNQPTGLAIDGAGNLYVADYLNAAIKKMQPTGGYFANKLPLGLTINTATGVIDGVPITVSLPTNYTVTAYNGMGSNTATVNIYVIHPTSPAITYSSPQILSVNNAMTPLTPANSASTVPNFKYSSITNVLSNALNKPNSIAVDAAGYIYVSNSGSSAVQKIQPGGGVPVYVGSGYINPAGVAVDAAGNVYVGDYSNNVVKKVPIGGGATVAIGGGFSGPTGVAVDAAGNVYVADFNGSAVKEILASNGSTITLGSGFNHPNAVAVDAAGNVYVADALNGAVKKIPAGNGPVVTIATGLLGPYGIAVDPVGDIFVAERDNNAIREYPAGGGASFFVGSGFNAPYGVALDTNGNLYVADYFDNAAAEIKIVGGFYLHSALPAGLSMDSNNGTISGTPTAVSPATNYTVTAYNEGGNSTTTVNIKVNLLPLPVISYSTPKTYVINTAIAPLTPASTGGPIASPAYSSTPVAVGSGFSLPTDVAVDKAGNIYVADRSNNLVKKMPAGGGTPVIIGTGFSSPSGVVVDSLGNVFVSDEGNNVVKKIPVGGGATTTIATGFNAPFGLAIDTAGNIYVADEGNNVVKKIPFDGSPVTTVGSGFTTPTGVALDAAGNIYVADLGNNAVKMIPVGGGSNVTIASGFNQPTGVKIDASGNIFVADFQNNAVKEILAGTNTVISIGSGYNRPFGVAVDPSGILYVADYLGSAIKQIMPVGGFYLNKTLPAGLTLNSSTGVISGTPTVTSPAYNYVITAYNVSGSGVGNVFMNISATASNNANLSALSISNGTLSPIFNTTTTTYKDTVVNTVTSVTLTPTVGNAHATVKVNGVLVASGTASASIPVNVGPNTITAIVTAEDGVTTKTYTVTVYRISNYALLSNLTVSSGTLSPVFNVTTVAYKDTVPNTVTSLTLTPTLGNPHAKVKVNGVLVASGTASASIPVNVGPNTITAVVTAEDGVTTKTYTVTVYRISNYAWLSNLSISSGTLSPVFSVTTVAYKDTVLNTVSSVTLTPTLGNPHAQVKVNGVLVASGTTSASIPITVGPNTITAVVTAEDGVTTKTYTVAVFRISNNALLSNLTISQGVLSPAFASNTISYHDTVSNSVASVTVTPVTGNAHATVKVNGVLVTSGIASASIPVNVGPNTITSIVTAEDGVTTKTYTVAVFRISNNALLSNLTISQGVLSPAFASNTISYHDTVSNSIASVTLTPVTGNAHATVKVNGVLVTSGTASASIPVNVGPNTITSIVTAEDGVTTKTYTVAVFRISNNALLSNLTISKGVLSPVFASNTISYHDTVSNSIASLTVTPVTGNAHATVKVNGTLVTSGSASATIPLSIGNNTITAFVTAEDGVTTKTYTVTVHRLTSGGLNSLYLPGSGEQTPLVASLNEKVEANNILSPNGDGVNDIWVVKNIAFYPNNTVSVYDRAGKVVFTKRGYTNDWDGTYRGSVLSEGTYYYLVDLGNGNNIKGFITVVTDR